MAEHAGLFLDPWQRYLLEHGLGQELDGDWTAKKVSDWTPRQNGKGGVIEALELGWLFITKEDLIVHSAHQHRTSQKAYERLERIIRRTPDLHRQVRQYRQANGEQQIELKDERLLQYTTRSRTAVRGFSAPKLVLDEAQELNSEQMNAILPTVSAMPNWQVWFFGTPPSDPTAWAYGLREDGEAGVPRMAHFDWGRGIIPEDPDEQARLAGDLDEAYAANPTLGDRIAETTVLDEARPSGLGILGYLQERLGMWYPRATGGAGVIPAELWREQADPVDKRGERPADVALCIQVNYRRTHTAIVAVGRCKDGRLLTSIVDYRPGTHWVVERAVELKAKWNPIAIAVQDKGPTGSLLEEMAKAGLSMSEDKDRPQRGDLVAPWWADAYGMYVDAVHQRRLWHLDEAPLNSAVATADTRASSSGGTAWDYKGVVDPSPLLASTAALWAYLTRVDAIVDRVPRSKVW